jgi:CHAT domain-containing protein
VSGSEIRHVELPGSSEIEALVREHQSAIASALADPLGASSPGDRLFRLLVAPVARDIPPGARIVIVPDGALHGLNFETLPVDGPRRHYWIEDVEIQVAPSLAGIATPRQASSGSGTVLIIGDAVSRPPEFPSLKFAGVEMKKVADHFDAGRVTTIGEERATPSAYRGAEPHRFSYVHFAAHATANRDSPLDSAVILSGSDDSYKLYARDVAALPLSADLVTVSACRSAGERTYSGEGLVGFAWAFLRAGARRVVAGLWDVDDQSTADLMDRLYAGVATGEPPSAALRQAKIALARQGARPIAWGAFQLFTVVP